MRLRELLQEPDTEHAEKTKGERVVEMACEAALNGEFRFFKEILERVEVKVPTQIAVRLSRSGGRVNDCQYPGRL